MGAAFGTSKAGIGIAGLGSFKPERIMKASLAIPLRHPARASRKAQSLVPVVMAGIIAVYGLVVSVLIAGARTSLDKQHLRSTNSDSLFAK